METREQKIRRFVYDHFLQLQRPPSVSEIAAHLGLLRDRVIGSLHKLHIDHILVLEDGKSEIRMAMPFSAVNTGVRVRSGGKSWWVHCAWDALGIPAMLSQDAEIDSVCPDCSDSIHLVVRNDSVEGNAGIIHFGVAVAHFWNDIKDT